MVWDTLNSTQPDLEPMGLRPRWAQINLTQGGPTMTVEDVIYVRFNDFKPKNKLSKSTKFVVS